MNDFDNVNERMHILELIESQKISFEEGFGLLQGLRSDDNISDQDHKVTHSHFSNLKTPLNLSPEEEKSSLWWLIPLGIGVGLTTLGGFLMLWVYQSLGVGFWFFCATVLFFFGVMIVFVAWSSRKVPWIHLKIERGRGNFLRRISISIPIPARFLVRILETFSHRIPNLNNYSIIELLEVLEKTTTSNYPIYIQINEDL